ncbi:MULTISPECIES: F0F1 ATP synthase subunit B [Pseudonocardia]|uniref:ATP synthase subunit b n=1 Tax=Pseudonocardia oroxyli TaxID=366584 RepID=A0A1G7MAV4_PSEOR|nr:MULTISPECIES: F0F1 ATP synthase subunit B [Pseudonocardia]MCF7551795.1 F0F1 ATP synthase subunit B [Pseudonocardia sp. WMMC193]SDF58270.1 ATP synthase F0 subcomplex B subunit [Pseudonocardia oroxyli]
MAEHGSGGKNAKGAALVAVVIGAVLLAYLLYVFTGIEAPLGADLTEIIVGLVAFAAVFVLLSRMILPKFEQIYAERADRIEGGLARAEEARAEAARLTEQYQSQVAEARAEAASIRDAARAEGAEVRAELRAAAEQDAASIRAAAAEQIAAQRAAAEQSLRGDVGTLSTQLAEKVLGSSLSATSGSSVQGYLAELDGARRN